MAIAQGYDVNREWGNSIRYARRLVGLGYGLSGGQVARPLLPLQAILVVICFYSGECIPCSFRLCNLTIRVAHSPAGRTGESFRLRITSDMLVLAPFTRRGRSFSFLGRALACRHCACEDEDI